MSESQEKFIRQLKITLISVLGPFVLITLASMVNDHYKIKTNTEHIEFIRMAKVDERLMIQYVNELRNLFNTLREDMNEQEVEVDEQLQQINERIDKIVKEIYKYNPRGIPNELR